MKSFWNSLSCKQSNYNFKYKLSLYYAFEDKDEDLIDCLLSRYHDFIFNGLEDKTYSTDFEVIPIELNEFLVDE